MRIPSRTAPRSAGFSLVEVMVALVVCSIGLLGLAKMESLALASTNVAGTRSLVAIYAASLAATMHADRGYWASGLAPSSTTVSGTGGAVTVGNNGTALTIPTACSTPGAGSCSNTSMAGYNLNQWGLSLLNLLPNYFTSIACSTTGLPVTCTITVTWSENAVAINEQQTSDNSNAGDITALNLPTYTLFVQP
jgi:type IV pilus assembly protein PilV